MKHIFIIENKIRDNSSREGQLKEQYASTIATLSDELEKQDEEIKNILSIIFISPDAEKSNSEYQELCKDPLIKIPKIQVHWNKSNETDSKDVNTITFFLRQILKHESEGEIEAINEQTKFTIKSFISFVDNDFKSLLEEELESEINRMLYTDFFKFSIAKKEEFNNEAWNIIEQFQNRIGTNYPNLILRHSLSHPVSVFFKTITTGKFGTKIADLTKRGKSICVQLVSSNFDLSEEKNKELNDFLKNYKLIEITEKEKIIILYNNLSIENIIEIFEKFLSLLKK